ncbi:hypothetical protein, partial [Rhizobium johnstonii]|uniref:hypothetical protein n=1 Tax=Rhizobium johnstonii TaxID=3019933 RepID=UPI003F960F00
ARRVVPPDLMAPAARSPIFRKLIRPEERPPPESFSPSPQWFNTGLHWAYGIDGPGQGHFYVDPFTGKLTKSKSAYE